MRTPNPRPRFLIGRLATRDQEQSQTITNAKGRPIPTALPITIAIAKTKPTPACHDMSPLLCGSCRAASMTDQSLLRQAK
jgi:hypothetical protein